MNPPAGHRTTDAAPLARRATRVAATGDAVGNSFGSLDRRNTAEQIADRVVTAIALGEFVEGQRLPGERDLAEMLGASRPTIREAFQRLHSIGLIEIRRGRTSTAAERRTDADIAMIRSALEDYRNAGESREASRAADETLHRAISSATHNRYLHELSMELRMKISLGFQAEPYTPELRARALEQHPCLVEAVVEGAADAAAKISADHFGLTEETFRDVFARVEPEDGASDDE